MLVCENVIIPNDHSERVSLLFKLTFVYLSGLRWDSLIVKYVKYFIKR